MNADDVILVIGHPFGDVEVSMAEWIEIGPGPRTFVRPIAARSRSSGDQLPLSIIPLQYRNDEESRALIARGLLSDPWSTKPTSAT